MTPASERRVRRGGCLSEGKRRKQATRRELGFSLPELLAVMAMIAIAVAIGIPIINEQVRIAEVRAAADDLALHLRAARMISVTQHRTIRFELRVDPTNSFRYDRFEGQWREVAMPGRVQIDPASDREINFKENGSVDVASTIILESMVSGAYERWTATVSTVGLTTLAHERGH